MLNPHDFPVVGEAILQKDYQGLCDFFREVWGSRHEYVVLVGKQSANLNAAFAAAYPSDWECARAKDQVITDNALLLRVPEIAMFYRKKKYFPFIQLVVDMTPHGTELTKLLRSLRDAVTKVMFPYKPATQDEMYYLTKALAQSLSISVYAAGKSELLIEDIFEQRIAFKKRVYAQEFRALSQQISCFLQKIDATSAPFHLSYHLPKAPACPPGWVSQEWSYRGVKETVFIQPGHKVCVPTVRFRKTNDDPGVCLTSQVLFGHLPADDFAGIRQETHLVLIGKGLDFLSSSLSTPVPMEQRARIVSCLLSIVCLRDFLGDSFDMENLNLDAVARDVGWEGREEIKELLGDRERSEMLQTVLLEQLNERAAPILDEPIMEDLFDGDCNPENSYIESRLFGLAVNGEEYVRWMIQTRRIGQDFEGRIIAPVADILSWTHSGIMWEEPKRRPSSARRLACLLTLADSGLASFEYDCTPTAICPIVKAEYLSLATIPRRLSAIIPAAAYVENSAWLIGIQSETAAIDFLRKQREHEAVEWLMKAYACGQSANGWDFPLLDTRDWNQERDGSYLTFLKDMEGQSRKYLALAEEYIQGNKK